MASDGVTEAGVMEPEGVGADVAGEPVVADAVDPTCVGGGPSPVHAAATTMKAQATAVTMARRRAGRGSGIGIDATPDAPSASVRRPLGPPR
jgi:hypothetical protein